MYMTPYTKEEKLAKLRELLREAANEARAERDRDPNYFRSIKNPFAGGHFDGFDKAQTDWRKSLAEAILETDAATLLDEVIA